MLKTLERLMAKGLLVRAEADGVYRYRSSMSLPELQSSLIEQFFSRSLGGSIQPLVAYFDGQATVTDAELAELKELVKKLEEKRHQ